MYVQFYNQPDPGRYGRSDLPEDQARLRALLAELPNSALMLDIGCGNGGLAGFSEGYVGIDLSYYALQRLEPRGRYVQADCTVLPVKTASVKLIATVATLEHVPYPELALAEVDRVLRPGGLAYIFPAWFCRSWVTKGLTVRLYQDLGWLERLEKASIPLRNSILYRAPKIALQRCQRELRLVVKGHSQPLDYGRLTPNLTEFLISDSDASCSLDPHAVIIWFHSRGYRVRGAETILQRLLFPYAPVIVQKSMGN